MGLKATCSPPSQPSGPSQCPGRQPGVFWSDWTQRIATDSATNVGSRRPRNLVLSQRSTAIDAAQPQKSRSRAGTCWSVSASECTIEGADSGVPPALPVIRDHTRFPPRGAAFSRRQPRHFGRDRVRYPPDQAKWLGWHLRGSVSANDMSIVACTSRCVTPAQLCSDRIQRPSRQIDRAALSRSHDRLLPVGQCERTL